MNSSSKDAERKEESPAMTPQQAELTAGASSALSIYREMAVGNASTWHFLLYELTVLLSGLPGLLGLASRSVLYPCLFRRCGRRPAFGKGITLRGPTKISIGDKAIFDDYSVLDARGEHAAIDIGAHSAIGRFTTLAAKGGRIELGDAVNIGSYCRIATQSRIAIGASTLVAAYCYIGPGNHQQGDGNQPLISRPMEIKGGVEIGAHVWIGAHTTILDGVKIGEGAIVGAHSLVRDDVPAKTVVAGCPAKVVRGV